MRFHQGTRPHRITLVVGSVICLVLSSVALAGCTSMPAVLNPASSQASQIAGLFWVIFGVAAAIFLLVEILLVYSAIRFRSRPGMREPAQTHGNLRVETAWTIAPALILAGVFVAVVATMGSVTQVPEDPIRLKVTGHQWWWEVSYPDLKINTATDIHVPAGRGVSVELESVDVIHSFWAPQLAGKMDVIPGHTNTLSFSPDKAGLYQGRCAEYCGAQHANMAFFVLAEPQDQFDAWTKQMQALPVITPTTGLAAQGAQRFFKSACVGCHTIDTTQAQGTVGPNLTHFATRRTIAAGTLPNTSENLVKWLNNPQQVKPGNKMPNLHLDQQAIQELAAYLESLK